MLSNWPTKILYFKIKSPGNPALPIGRPWHRIDRRGMAVILASTRRPSPTASASGQLRASCSGYAHTGGKIEPPHQPNLRPDSESARKIVLETSPFDSCGQFSEFLLQFNCDSPSRFNLVGFENQYSFWAVPIVYICVQNEKSVSKVWSGFQESQYEISASLYERRSYTKVHVESYFIAQLSHSYGCTCRYM